MFVSSPLSPFSPAIARTTRGMSPCLREPSPLSLACLLSLGLLSLETSSVPEHAVPLTSLLPSVLSPLSVLLWPLLPSFHPQSITTHCAPRCTH